MSKIKKLFSSFFKNKNQEEIFVVADNDSGASQGIGKTENSPQPKKVEEPEFRVSGNLDKEQRLQEIRERHKGKAKSNIPAMVENRKPKPDAPQLLCLLADNSYSMSDDNKCVEATRVVKETMLNAQEGNEKIGGEGNNVSILTQVIMFAKHCADITNGMKDPSIYRAGNANFVVLQEDDPLEIGYTTNLVQPLEIAYETLKSEMSNSYKANGMPEPVVIVITDGMPNEPVPDSEARRQALEMAKKIKEELTIPEILTDRNMQPIKLEKGGVKIVAIGLGKEEIDESFLEELASKSIHPKKPNEEVPLYLYCPDADQLSYIGSKIVSSVTLKESGGEVKSLEEVIYDLRNN